jgi:hypothetical protein
MQRIIKCYRLNTDVYNLNIFLQELKPLEGYNLVSILNVERIDDSNYFVISEHVKLEENNTDLLNENKSFWRKWLS